MTPRWFLLRTFEVWLTTRLLASPTFHHLVGKVHSRVQRFKHGIPPEEMGGTKLDNNGMAALPRGPGFKQFFEYFKEELKDQAKGKPRDKF